MRCNRFGWRIFTLCLTFWLGILIADWFRVQPPKVIKPEEIRRVTVTFDQKQMSYNSVKLRCKKFYSDLDTELANERFELMCKQMRIAFSKQIKANREKLEARKLEEAALKLMKRFEDTTKEINIMNPDSGITHNLLYIENCAEYY